MAKPGSRSGQINPSNKRCYNSTLQRGRCRRMGSIISDHFGNIPQRFQHTCLNTVIHLVAPSQGSNASSKKDRIHLLLFSTWPGIGNLDPHDLYTLGSYTSHPHQELPSEVTKDCVAKEKAVQLAPREPHRTHFP